MIETNTPLHRFLVWLAVVLIVSLIGFIVYEAVFVGESTGELYYRRANLRLEENNFSEALEEFEVLLKVNPLHHGGEFGRGLALMGLKQWEASLAAFNLAIEIRPKFAAAYANRAILLDRMTRYREAVRDYRKALELKPSLNDGPGWITRFFRDQIKKPPTLADRLIYLEDELRKPPGERLFSVPELDEKERTYKVSGNLDSDE